MMVVVGVGAVFPVFFIPLIDEFQWSRTALAGTVSIGLIVGGLAMPIWGNWIDRSGGRAVVVVAASFAGLSMALRAGIGALSHLYILSALAALFIAGMGLIPLSTIISQWFRRKRGMAMGLTLVGGGLGSFLMPPAADYLIEGIGWRSSYVVLGVILWIGIIPLAALVLRRRPQDMGLLPHGEISESERAGENGDEKARARRKKKFERGEGFSLNEATSEPAFWLIAVAFFLPMMSGVGLLTHLVAIFMDTGISSRTASFCLGIIGGLSIVGRLGFGFAADRFSIRKVYAACFVLEAFAVCTLLAMPLLGANSLYAFVFLYGLTGGGGLVLAPLIIGECFGLKSLGTIFGMLAIAAVIGGAIGPVLAGVIFDSTGSYYRAFMIFGACEICAAVAISQARSPLKPE